MKTYLLSLLLSAVLFSADEKIDLNDDTVKQMEKAEISHVGKDIELFEKLKQGTYEVLEHKDLNYVQEENQFMYGDFVEIIRFDMLHFSGALLDSDSNTTFSEIVEKIKIYNEKCQDIKVTVIGHSSKRTDDYNEQVIDSDTYANKVENLFRFSQDLNQTLTKSSDYASKITEDLINADVNKSIIVTEYRSSLDKAFSSGTTYGRDLSNRVMVAIYVLTDGDKDKDGVCNYIDECPDTPLGVVVDEKGCPFDTDEDGVFNYKDRCPGTKKGLVVDAYGCTICMTLQLKFDNNSFEIYKDSYYKVVAFADFLKESPAYHASITGHTNSLGSLDDNQILSENRAKSVKEALISEGIDASKIVTKGEGELSPLMTNKTAEGLRANRRIEVKLFY